MVFLFSDDILITCTSCIFRSLLSLSVSVSLSLTLLAIISLCFPQFSKYHPEKGKITEEDFAHLLLLHATLSLQAKQKFIRRVKKVIII